MALIVIIAATTNAVDLASVAPMALDGLSKIKADDLSVKGEYVYLWEERVDGGYDRVKTSVNTNEFVALTSDQPSHTLIAKGNYKCTKTETSLPVGVGYV